MPSAIGEKSASSRGWNGGAFSRCGSLKRIAPINNAETTNDSELTMKTVSRPKAASRPPIPEPSASPTLQVTEDNAFATIVSSDPDVIVGITALRPGSNNAQKRVSRKSKTYSSDAVPG